MHVPLGVLVKDRQQPLGMISKGALGLKIWSLPLKGSIFLHPPNITDPKDRVLEPLFIASLNGLAHVPELKFQAAS